MIYPMWNADKTGIIIRRDDGGFCFVDSGPEFEALKNTAHYFERPELDPMEAERAAMICTPAQMRLALDDMEAPDDATKTMLDVVEGIVAQDRKASIVWEYATTIIRTSPLIEALGTDFTPEEIDDIFRVAMAVET